MKISAEWIDDCQGKKHFLGQFLSICIHYWPRGGGFFEAVRDNQTGTFSNLTTNEDRPQIPPEAAGMIVLHHGTEEEICIARARFEGETQEEVQQKAEKWAQERFDEIVELLKTKFQIPDRGMKD